MATRTVTIDDLPNGIFIGGGADTLLLSGDPYTLFDLTQSQFSGFTTISTDDNFSIRMTADQFAAISTINGTWYTYVNVIGSTIDLRGKSLSQLWDLTIDDGSTVQANTLASIESVNAFYTKNETLRFFGTLSASGRAQAHLAGYDTVVDDSGVQSVNPAPVVQNIFGERKLVKAGEIARLDSLGDASMTDDQGTVRLIDVESRGSSDTLRILGTDRLVFAKDDYGSFDIFFDGKEVGSYSKSESYSSNRSLSFHLNDTATKEVAEYILQHIDFVRGKTSASDNVVTVTVTDRGGRETAGIVVMQGTENTDTGGGGSTTTNHPPTDLLLANTLVSEASQPGMVIGKFSAFDSDGDPLSYSLSDSFGGTFAVTGSNLVLNGTLDFEQRSSYALQTTASDGHGGLITRTFTINVSDVIGEISTNRSSNAKLLGNFGRDQLTGNSGNEILGGGLDNDTLTGGAGRDTFLFDTSPSKTNVDRIMDFKPHEDHIQLDDAIFRKVGKVGVLKKGAFWTGTKAHDRDDRIIYNKKTGALYYDADGNGNGAAVKFAELSKKLALKHADFLIA